MHRLALSLAFTLAATGCRSCASAPRPLPSAARPWWLPVAASPDQLREPSKPNHSLWLGEPLAIPLPPKDPADRKLPPMTLEAWFRAPEQAEVFDPIVLADFPRIYLEFFPDREQLKVVLPIKGKSTAFLPMAHPHDWHHFAVTSDGLRGAVFLDGEPILEEVLDASGNAPMPQPTLRLGGSGKFPLLVDEVRVWSYGRSKEQLQAAMKRSLSGEEPGLLAYFSFEGDASGSITNKVVHPKWIPSAVPTPAKVAFVMDSPLAEPRVLDAGSSTPSTMPAGSSQSAH